MESFITNGPINLDAGSTIGGVGIADVNHTHPGRGGYGGAAIVATSGGDYTDPLNAMNDSGTWCSIPSEINRCVLRIMPGVYNIGSNPLPNTIKCFAAYDASYGAAVCP